MKIKILSQQIFSVLTEGLARQISQAPPEQMPNREKVKEMGLRRAKLAIDMAESFHTQWEAEKARFKEDAEE